MSEKKAPGKLARAKGTQKSGKSTTAGGTACFKLCAAGIGNMEFARLRGKSSKTVERQLRVSNASHTA